MKDKITELLKEILEKADKKQLKEILSILKIIAIDLGIDCES
jgi:hypothetical protein